jgi:hypothetical protein
MSKENLIPVLIWIAIHIICIGFALREAKKGAVNERVN